MSDRSSVRQARLRRLTMVFGALGALGVIVAELTMYLVVRRGGMLTAPLLVYVATAIAGAFPFMLITFGRPHRPTVALVVCLLLIGLNTYGYLWALLSDSSTAGVSAVGANLYSWVIWGVGMAVDAWRRERTLPLAPPPRPDRS